MPDHRHKHTFWRPLKEDRTHRYVVEREIFGPSVELVAEALRVERVWGKPLCREARVLIRMMTLVASRSVEWVLDMIIGSDPHFGSDLGYVVKNIGLGPNLD